LGGRKQTGKLGFLRSKTPKNRKPKSEARGLNNPRALKPSKPFIL
jgi:hypothetical protein